MKKYLSILAILSLSITGCAASNNSCQSTITQQNNQIIPENLAAEKDECFINNPTDINVCKCQKCIMKIEVKGMGTTPTNALTSAQAKLMARRAAILEGYKALAEKLYGIRINSRESMRNMILQNSNLRVYVDGLIRGANIEEEGFKDGIYTVVMSLKIDLNEWNKFLKEKYTTAIYDF